MSEHTLLFEAQEIRPEELLAECQKLADAGYRFVAMSVVDLGADESTGRSMVDVIYHFDKERVLTQYRMTVPRDEPIPSISPVYWCALLSENENSDLFGLQWEGLVLDYKRTLYLDEEITSQMKAPFCNLTVFEK